MCRIVGVLPDEKPKERKTSERESEKSHEKQYEMKSFFFLSNTENKFHLQLKQLMKNILEYHLIAFYLKIRYLNLNTQNKNFGYNKDCLTIRMQYFII